MPLDLTERLTKKTDDYFGVWDENLPALEIYQACADQWNIITSMVGIAYQGLKNESILATFDMFGIEKTKRKSLLFDVKTIAHGAAEILNGK